MIYDTNFGDGTTPVELFFPPLQFRPPFIQSGHWHLEFFRPCEISFSHFSS